MMQIRETSVISEKNNSKDICIIHIEILKTDMRNFKEFLYSGIYPKKDIKYPTNFCGRKHPNLYYRYKLKKFT